jgi:hypothetical protein
MSLRTYTSSAVQDFYWALRETRRSPYVEWEARSPLPTERSHCEVCVNLDQEFSFPVKRSCFLICLDISRRFRRFLGSTALYDDPRMCSFSVILHLLIDAVYNWDYVAWNNSIIVNNELERIWKETALVWFKVMSWYLSGGTEKTDERTQCNWFSGGVSACSTPGEPNC